MTFKELLITKEKQKLFKFTAQNMDDEYTNINFIIDKLARINSVDELNINMEKSLDGKYWNFPKQTKIKSGWITTYQGKIDLHIEYWHTTNIKTLRNIK